MTDLTQPAAALLDHAEFLRRLAGQLTGLHAADADDLAQDTWAATLQRPPRDHRSARGWLATVTGNLWRNERRSRARRATREAAAARREAVPGVDEIAAREEVRRRVVAAVLELPDELREVVVLRFYEGLDSRAIGARLGRPASTVRNRMQTALERMRRRLDRDYADKRAAWAAPLAQWARFLHAPTVPSLAAGTSLRLLAGALLLTGCAAWLWWPQPAGARPAAAPTATSRAATAPRVAAVPAATPDVRVDATPPRVTPAPVAASYPVDLPAATVTGFVTDARSARPLPEATVTLRAVAAAGSSVAALPDDRRTRLATMTDVAGAFAFAPVPAGLYELGATTRDGHTTWQRAALAAGAQRIDLRAAPQPFAGLVAVKVTDELGLAVADADVTVMAHCQRFGAIGYAGAPPLSGRTDAAGRFVHRDAARLDHVFEGLVVARTRDGRVGLACYARPEHRSNNPYLDVVVAAPAAIAGRLEGPADDWQGAAVTAQPLLVYAHVMPEPATGEVTVAVDGDGAFAFDALPAGRYHLRVDGTPGLAREQDHGRAPSWQFLPVTEVAAGARAEVVIAMSPAGAVRGVVRDAAGDAVAGARVVATMTDGGAGLFHHLTHEASTTNVYSGATAHTDVAGRYALDLLPGTWQVAVTAPGLSVDARSGVRVEVGAPPTGLEHRLVADGAVCMRTPAGPIALRREPAPDVVHVLSGNEGIVTVRGLAPGRWQVGMIDHEQRFDRVASVDVAAGRTRWLDLFECGDDPVRGVVHLDGRPLAGVQVAVEGAVAAATTAADGSFVLTSGAALVGAGQRLALTHRGQAVAMFDRDPAGGDVGVLELEARRVDVRVVDERGAPTAATVWLHVMYVTLDAPVRRHLPDGRLDDQLVPRGAGYASARFADGSEVTTRFANDDATIELRRRPSGALAVRLVDAQGAPRVGANLQAVAWGRDTPAPSDGPSFFAGRDAGHEARYARTDAEGRATFAGLPPGPALVWFAGSWHRFGYEQRPGRPAEPPPAERIAVVRAGATTPVELALR